MAPREEDLGDTIARLYRAAVDPAGWSPALRATRDLLGGAGGAVFVMDAPGRSILSWHSIGLEPDGSEYGQRLHSINPRVRVSLAEAPGTINWDYRGIAEAAMDGHEFYASIERLSGVRYFIGVRYLLDGGQALFTSVERTRRQSHVETSDIALYERVAPHIRNALEISARVAPTRRKAGLFDLLDHKPGEGLVLLAETGRVIEMNDQAACIVAQRDGLSVSDGRLRPWKAADLRKLNALVAEAVAVAAGESFGQCGVMALSRPSRSLSYLLRVVPWPLAANGAEAAVAAVVFIIDPQAKGHALRHDLAVCFGLTPREADMAGWLLAGRSLPEAARAMKVSHNTARVHLRHVFEKIGVSSQGDLLRLLRSLS